MKKGFTLIELLAVIVILAIIAVIAVPIVLNIIDETKISSIKSSANSYLKTVELSLSSAQINNKNDTYMVMADGNICIGNIEENKCNGEIVKIEVKGEKPKRGEIINKKGKIKINYLEINNYIYYRDNNEYLVEKASKHTIMSNTSLITFDSSKLGTLSNYKIYGNTKKIEEPKNIADPQQVENFVAGMQALGTTNYGNYTKIITDDNGREILNIFSPSGYGHENYDELRKIFKGIFKENEQYTISFDYYNNTTSETVNMRINYTDGVGEVLNNFKISPGEAEKGKVYSFEHTTLANKTISSIDIRFAAGDTYIYLDTLQIEEGTSKTKYVPYGKFDYPSVGNFIEDKTNKNYGKYEIPIKVTGKNLFNENDLLEVSSVTKVDNGYSVAAYPAQYGVSSKLYKKLKLVLKSGIPYTISRKVSNYIKASSGSIWLRDSDSNLVTTNPYGGIKSSTFNLSNSQISNFSEIWIYGLGENPTIYEYIQLEMGDQTTEYEPYREENYSIYINEPLRCFDDICDYIDYQRGIVVRHIEQIYNSGDKEFEESFKIRENPKYEKVSLPKLKTNEGISNIFINTYIKPSNIIISST